MKTAIAFLAGLLIAGLLPFAYSQRCDACVARDRPPEITPADWVPISASLGLALVEDPKREGVVLPGPAGGTLAGHFMVKHGGRWQRLVVVEPLGGGLRERL
jgi:hypothetical protein